MVYLVRKKKKGKVYLYIYKSIYSKDGPTKHVMVKYLGNEEKWTKKRIEIYLLLVQEEIGGKDETIHKKL